MGHGPGGGARTPSTSVSSDSSSGDEQTPDPDPGQTFRPDPGQTCRLDPGHRPDVRTASDVAETCPRSPSGRREAAEEVGNTETSPLTGEGSVSDDADQVSSLSDSPRQHSDQSVAYRSDGDSVSVGSPTASSPQSSQSSESDCERTRQPAADTAQQRYDSLCRSLETLICSAESEEPARGEPAVSGGSVGGDQPLPPRAGRRRYRQPTPSQETLRQLRERVCLGCTRAFPEANYFDVYCHVNTVYAWFNWKLDV
ncbi:hypothetical protein FJT64_009451 [Amphibalanus amphitrite]|uniref:Uncharacterized protein n=1 Tax=Amphibalanus amphitrite TaxID=1232801 RepID=A0A6A4VDI8_AMPAM|nr:hypothetical protein FJT64_009451 [Amphibalanus amphitrite]